MLLWEWPRVTAAASVVSCLCEEESCCSELRRTAWHPGRGVGSCHGDRPPLGLGGACSLSECLSRQRQEEKRDRRIEEKKVFWVLLWLHQWGLTLAPTPLMPSECQNKSVLGTVAAGWLAKWSAQSLPCKPLLNTMPQLLLGGYTEKRSCWHAMSSSAWWLLCLLGVMAGMVMPWPFSCSSGWSPAWLGLGSR